MVEIHKFKWSGTDRLRPLVRLSRALGNDRNRDQIRKKLILECRALKIENNRFRIRSFDRSYVRYRLFINRVEKRE